MTTTTTAVRLPTPHDVRELLTGLLGRDVELTSVPPWAPASGERAVSAVYVDDRYALRGVGIADLGFAAAAGGAIGLLPPGGVREAVAEGVMWPALVENFDEVLNICAALLNAEGSPHVKLASTHGVAELPPAGVVAHGQLLGRRIDLHLTVAGYGAGHLSLVLAP